MDNAKNSGKRDLQATTPRNIKYTVNISTDKQIDLQIEQMAQIDDLPEDVHVELSYEKQSSPYNLMGLWIGPICHRQTRQTSWKTRAID